MRSRVLASGTAVVAALALTPVAAACGHHGSHHPGSHPSPRPTHHATVNYVNLGDSYSAGTGLTPLATGAPAACRQSTLNAAHVNAAKYRLTLTDVACSGADTTDFTTSQGTGIAPQLNALSKKTNLVTMMMGGNDSNVFSNTITQCSTLGYQANGKGSPCKDKYGNSFVTTITTKTYPALLAAFREVRAKAPHARVAVIGYPRLMPETTSCFPQMPIADGDVAYVNTIQKTLNAAIAKAASRTGVQYIDTFKASAGHDACQATGTRWVEPVFGYVTQAPAHPNQLGASKLAAITAQALRLK